MTDLSINFAGISSPNPFWLASGPNSNTASQVARAFEKGWGGAVWKTIIPEAVNNVTPRLGAIYGTEKRLVGMTNIELVSDRTPEENFKEIADLRKKFPDRPIIASLMAQDKDEWKDLIRRTEDTGANGIELNLSCPHGMNERGMGSAAGVEPKVVKEITAWARELSSLPIIPKMTPNITDVTEPSLAAIEGGAHALALINTVRSIIGVDINTFSPIPTVSGKGTSGGLSGPAIKPIALAMVAQVASHPKIKVPITGIGGISSWKDAVEFMLLGATSVQVCTAIMRYGYDIIEGWIQGLESYMKEKGFEKITDFIGKALKNYGTWGELDLSYRVIAKINYETCTACQSCYIACRDGGHEAIELPEKQGKEKRIKKKVKPVIVAEKCKGCGLCPIVCPVDAIKMV